MAELVGALDQGTTSTRFLVFDGSGHEVARHQLEHRQILPKPGWVEHDPRDLWESLVLAARGAIEASGVRQFVLVEWQGVQMQPERK